MTRRILMLLVPAVLAAACGTRLPDSAGPNAQIAAATPQPGTPQAAGGSAAGVDAAGGGGQATHAAAASGANGAGPVASNVGPTGAGTPSAAAVSQQGGPTQSDPGVTDTEIRIGASGPLSGVTAPMGAESFGAVDSYFQLVNSQGGINGRKLRLIALDDRLDSAQQASNVRRLFEQDKVVAVFVVASDAISQYVTRNNIPTMAFGVTAPPFSSKYPTVFPIVGNALVWDHVFIEGLREKSVLKPGMKVGILYDTQILDVSPYLGLFKEGWEKAGAKVVSTDPFNLSDGDCTSLVLKMKNLGIDYWDFQGAGWVLCASAAARQRWRPNVGWGGWPASVSWLASQAGPWVDGMWSASQGDQPDGKPRSKTPAHDEYANAIRRFHPDISSPGNLESPATIGYWVGARLLTEALKAQGTVITRQGVIRWLQSARNFDSGISPPVRSMAPNCKTGSEVLWLGRWHWDASTSTLLRTPETGYVQDPFRADYGGDCFLTRLSDSVTGG